MRAAVCDVSALHGLAVACTHGPDVVTVRERFADLVLELWHLVGDAQVMEILVRADAQPEAYDDSRVSPTFPALHRPGLDACLHFACALGAEPESSLEHGLHECFGCERLSPGLRVSPAAS